MLDHFSYHACLLGAAATKLRILLPREPRPLVASIRLSDRCNSRCVTCNSWRLADGPEIATERAIRLLAEIKALRIRALRFSGGEPLLRRDLFNILASCSERDFARVTVATNGLLLHKLSGPVNESIITHLTVSLDGMHDRHDRIRGIRGAFERVVRGLAVVKKPIRVVSTVTKLLVPDLEELIRLCSDRGWAFDVNLPTTKPKLFQGDDVKEAVARLWPSPDEVDRMVEILSQHRILSDSLLRFAAAYLKTGREPMRQCLLGYITIGIEPDGSVLPGCYFNNLGNINEHPLAELLRSPEYIDIVRRNYDLQCVRCTCGYGLSVLYESPVSNAAYACRRLHGTLTTFRRPPPQKPASSPYPSSRMALRLPLEPSTTPGPQGGPPCGAGLSAPARAAPGR